MKIGILSNESPESSLKWELSCRKAGIDYKVIDLTSYDWYDQIIKYKPDFFVLRPSGETFKYKHLYDERLYVVNQVMGYFVFPSFKEVFIYENKRMLANFLTGSGISMPDTYVFYNEKESLDFIETASLPIVGKTGIGASGTGVKIIRTRNELRKYIKKAFGRGIRRRFGPNRSIGKVSSWSKKAVASPKFFLKKLKKYTTIYRDAQKGFVILQEFIKHDYEWRIVKIGNSWFGHRKIKQGDKASGTKGIDYIPPPTELLNFCKNICDEQGFNCMAMDVFEHPTKGYVINELQTIFGHVQDYILAVNGKPGRYQFKDGQWIFEAGDFSTNESYDLRLETAVELYKQSLT